MSSKFSGTKVGKLVGLFSLALILGACATGAIREKMLTMPAIDGATYVGQDTCLECHEDMAEHYSHNIHARLADFEMMGGQQGCEACHGPGSLHVDNDGDTEKILMFGELKSEEVGAVCATCHVDGGLMDWTHSEHALADLSCTDCHSIHAEDAKKAYLKQEDPELCYSCHGEMLAKSNFPSHHPVKEGKMSCGDCHNPHGELNTHERTNDLCLDCHTRYQGPFVFGHAPVEDDCTICHDPHGSVANNLLVQNEPFLCLQCHEGHFHMLRKGFDPDTGTYYDGDKSDYPVLTFASKPTSTDILDAYNTLNGTALTALPADIRFFTNQEDAAGDVWKVYSRSTTNTALTDAANPHGLEGFQMSFGTKCTTCHQVVHGSDFPSQPLSGGGLTR